MVDLKQFETFCTDKQGFYSNAKTIAEATKLANDHDARFLSTNKLLIEKEFNQLFSALKKNSKDREEFLVYCHYCCVMMEKLYSTKPYENEGQVISYREKKDKLQYRVDKGKFPDDEAEDSFLHMLQKKLAASLGSLVSTPIHTTKIRDWLGFANIYRIHFVFCRLAVKQSLLLGRELQWLEKLDQLLGIHTDVDGMVSIINAPAGLFNALSVGLFTARLILNAGVLLKHTLSSSGEKGPSALSRTERFYNAFYMNQRNCVMLNDFVWGTVNGLSNYAAYFNISAPVAAWLTAGFLVFDVSLLVYRRSLAEKEYQLKRDQYEYEKGLYLSKLKLGTITAVEMKRYIVLNEQIDQLDISWQSTSATYYFNIAAAALLMGGFSASLLLATPVAAAVCFSLCVIAVAMYLSADMYGKYVEKSEILKHAEWDELQTKNRETEPTDAHNNLAIALFNAQTARNDFITGMIKNTVMPILIVTTFAMSLPAALILTAAYIGYEWSPKKKPKPPEVSMIEDIEGDEKGCFGCFAVAS